MSAFDTGAISLISLAFRPEGRAAVVNESGCGNLMTLQLLEKYFDVESVRIRVAHVDIAGLSQILIRSQIATG
jgi:ABC-type multidrug transport system fused ATPase/permease subunit